MKTSEIRIGNIIEWNKEPFNVCRIFDNSVKNESWCKPINELHGIEITEKELLKFGFDNIQDEDQFTLEYDSELGTGFLLIWVDKSLNLYPQEGVIFLNHIKHVHQLQNLYFALTGEELTYLESL